ncbi:ABC transporter, fused ATPase and inner membrane subunits [Parvularcula bermudensis HTCC2503]|uniref:ABC transporter, fused ATPase and inner membrane subunits n=1 Tax=Parvularcula bermudensis (strain ATCC BAA-594 / HTCC2503 / KCTC 12087) TaxID=314260 RepID=E0TD46_PARBH|nr:ABC transporter ATP-binding protein/permease [Parvularcula bermudensis]ADM08705.1 ABC transporter, fused ATPase and inner membrane subunits [Parvularcula bermudensis HTCC2503]
MSPRLSNSAEAPHAESSLREQLGSIATLFPYLWRKDRPGFRPRIIGAVIVILTGQMITVAAPLLLAMGINRLAEQDEALGLTAAIGGFILGYGIFRLLSAALPQMREFLFSVVSQTAQREVAVTVFDHLHSLSLRFHLERRTGGLSRVIERGIRSIDFLFRFLLFNIGPTLVQLLIVSIAFGLRYSWSLVIIVVVTVVLYFYFTATSTEWRLKFRRQMNEKDQLANTRAVDALLNYETVKYFTAERYESGRYDEALTDYQDAAVKSQNSLAVVNIGQALIINLGLVSAVFVIARGVANGIYGIGEITGVSLIMMQLYQPLNILGFAYREIKQALIDMERMFGLLKLRPEIDDAPTAQPLVVTGGTLVFDNVHFAYDREREVLKGVDLTVEAGKKVAVVGPSGAGKSTLARLLYRFYEATDGEIRIDDQPITMVTQTSLRHSIGVVPQDTVLFNDTIGYNIAYGRPNASHEDIEEAARLAQIHDFIIGLPKGYQTMVGERGLKLSGGEKQRVAIARTILKNPPILILDEATSALDSATEQSILGALKRIEHNRTTLVIAHRLSTIIDADLIVVLKEGAIVETGTHDSLLEQAGLYAELWQRQLDGYTAGADIQAAQ